MHGKGSAARQTASPAQMLATFIVSTPSPSSHHHRHHHHDYHHHHPPSVPPSSPPSPTSSLHHLFIINYLVKPLHGLGCFLKTFKYFQKHSFFSSSKKKNPGIDTTYVSTYTHTHTHRGSEKFSEAKLIKERRKHRRYTKSQKYIHESVWKMMEKHRRIDVSTLRPEAARP